MDDVIAMRAHDPQGLNRMLTLSLAVHLGFVLIVFVIPRDWISRAKPQPILISLNLGGPAGERSGGMNPAPARPIEQVAPPPKVPEPVRPVAPKPDVMSVPTKTPPKPTPPKPTDRAPSPIARPTTGAQIRPGTSRAETGVVTPGTGLTVGGGGGAEATLDATFCCPEWAEAMLREIRGRWQSAQNERGETTLKFTVLRDGRITDVEVERPSGSGILDRASKDALPQKLTSPLPKQYPDDRLVIHLKFPYTGR